MAAPTRTEAQKMSPKRGFAGTPFTVTPSDSVFFSYVSDYLYVGVTGDVTTVNEDGTVTLYKAVPAGSQIVGNHVRVNSTGTTASQILGHVCY